MSTGQSKGASRVGRALAFGTGILAVAWAAQGSSQAKVYFDDANFHAKWLAAMTQAAGALPIDPRDGDQVRIWYDGVMARRVTGYIVTTKGTWRCHVVYRNDNGEYIVAGKGSCGAVRNRPEKLARARARFAEGPGFDGKNFACDTMDGWDANIEGFVGGKHFMFHASNTQTCTEPDIKQVDSWLDDITRAGSRDDD